MRMQECRMLDVVIIGGGVAGLSAAAALAPDFSVQVLEAEAHLGTHASARSAAVFLEPYGNATVRALNSVSAPVYRSMEVFQPRPLLMLARPEHCDLLTEESALYGCREISVSAAHTMWPILETDTVARAAVYDGAYDIDTDRVVQGFASQARAAGASLVTGARVTKLTHDMGWRIETLQGSVRAHKIVIAAGAWADQVGALAGAAPLGLQPRRRSMARLAAPGGRDVRDWPFVLDISEGWYAKPDAGAWLVSPADADPMPPHDAWADDLVLAEGLARYQAFATEPVTRPIASWAGLRTFAPDSALVIGPDARVPDLWWLAGQGGYGFQTAPAAAGLLADLMRETTPLLDEETIAALAPNRAGLS